MKQGKTRRVQVVPTIIIGAATFAVAFPVVSSSTAWLNGYGKLVVAGLLVLFLLVYIAVTRAASETGN